MEEKPKLSRHQNQNGVFSESRPHHSHIVRRGSSLSSARSINGSPGIFLSLLSEPLPLTKTPGQTGSQVTAARFHATLHPPCQVVYF